MGEDFWGPIFASLHENQEFLRQLCHDTDDADLLNWIMPNQALARRCAGFIRKHKITDRAGLIDEVLGYAESDQALRKIILFTWVEKNPRTMGFASIAATADNIKKLYAGEFGKPEKIRLLARIDPRPGAEKIYQQYFASQAGTASVDAITETTETQSPKVASELINESLNDVNADIKVIEANAVAVKAVKRSRELEGALESVKAENKLLKKQLEARNKEVPGLSRKLEESILNFKSADEKVKLLTHQIAGLKLQAQNMETAQIKAAKQPMTVDLSERNTSETLCNELQQQLTSLQKALQNRDNSIARLEAEKEELLQRLRGNEEQQHRIENLQQTLRKFEAENSGRGNLVVGQLIAPARDQKNRSAWLFVSLSGQPFHLPAELVKAAKIVTEELALLQLNSAQEPVKLDTLETENRKEIYGFLKSDPNGFWLVSDCEERLPIHISVDQQLLDRPVRGVYLPETSNREAGIYQIEVLKLAEQQHFEALTVSEKQLKTFFNTDRLDFDLFCTELGKLNVNFKLESDHQIRFSRDYRQVLNGLRQQLPIIYFCNAQTCIDRAKLVMLARNCQPGQTCNLCGRVPKADIAGETHFKGQHVLIFGGDRIGSEYERVLPLHNLQVTWHSGFKNLHELKSGLGKADAIVVIVKQISHTLLREIVPQAEKEKIPIIYCTRRGTSGVLSHLADALNAIDKKK